MGDRPTAQRRIEDEILARAAHPAGWASWVRNADRPFTEADLKRVLDEEHARIHQSPTVVVDIATYRRVAADYDVPLPGLGYDDTSDRTDADTGERDQL